MLTPGVPPIPHVGGPVSLGSPMVLIGGMPAARMGDMLVCVGPPDTIAMGCMTVLIGEGGSGSASGGGAGGSGAEAAQAGAKSGKAGSIESAAKSENWVEMKFTDKTGKPVSGINYKFKDTDSKESKSVLRQDGRIKRDGIKEGEVTANLISLHGAQWSKEKAEVGDKVKLSVECIGIKDNTPAEFIIYIRDANYSDHLLKRLEAKTSGEKAGVEWEIEVDEELLKISDKKDEIGRYSQPYFYFDVFCDGLSAKSPLLFVVDFVEIKIKDDEGKALADQKYKISLPSGEIKTGTLDGNGSAKIEKITPGQVKIELE
jgi:uncharacterized Zn-binding protein involved in type VI secretion